MHLCICCPSGHHSRLEKRYKMAYLINPKMILFRLSPKSSIPPSLVVVLAFNRSRLCCTPTTVFVGWKGEKKTTITVPMPMTWCANTERHCYQCWWQSHMIITVASPSYAFQSATGSNPRTMTSKTYQVTIPFGLELDFERPNHCSDSFCLAWDRFTVIK